MNIILTRMINLIRVLWWKRTGGPKRLAKLDAWYERECLIENKIPSITFTQQDGKTQVQYLYPQTTVPANDWFQFSEDGVLINLKGKERLKAIHDCINAETSTAFKTRSTYNLDNAVRIFRNETKIYLARERKENAVNTERDGKPDQMRYEQHGTSDNEM